MNYKGTKRGLKAKASREVAFNGRISDETRADLYEAFPKEAEQIIANYEGPRSRRPVSAQPRTPQAEKIAKRRERRSKATGVLTSMVMALVWVLSKINGGSK